MEQKPSNSDNESGEISGASLARWRQIYQLAKAGAEGFDFNQIPPEILAKLQAEPAEND
ncbi:MAG TPA: hypothetical protein VFP35_03570 [Candidatus Saccharimonadales bacterium]|nr:hypothetical protein [Candidatus Saccharimonadales bacterium]